MLLKPANFKTAKREHLISLPRAPPFACDGGRHRLVRTGLRQSAQVRLPRTVVGTDVITEALISHDPF